MIQVNELRIGNWVNVTHVHFDETEISTIKIDDLVRIYTNITTYDYNPIPITEEWLSQFGFRKNITYDRFELYPLYVIKLINKDSLSNYNLCVGIDSIWAENIKYVHQLQNMYFSLTNKELTFDVS